MTALLKVWLPEPCHPSALPQHCSPRSFPTVLPFFATAVLSHATAAVVFFIASSLTLGMTGARAQAPPNVIMILVDDQGWGGTSVEMDPNVEGSFSNYHQTPSLESLARDGLRFSQAYVSPKCTSTRAALQTGKSWAQLQMSENHTEGDPKTNSTSSLRMNFGHRLSGPLPRIQLPPEEVTIAERVKEVNPNYVTGFFGKWAMRTFAGEEYNGYDYATSGVNSPLPPERDPKYIFNLTNLANDFMRDRVASDEPFFMLVSHYSVHGPFEALPETVEKYQNLEPGDHHWWVTYGANTEDLDTGVGMLLQEVEDLGIEENTYIVYVSDNGASSYRYNLPLSGSKGTLSEGGIRVPLIIKGPGIEGGTVSNVPVIGMDILPTISEFVGGTTPLPEGVEGTSLVPVLENSGQLPEGMAALSRQYGPNGELFFHYPHLLINRPESAIRDGDHKLIKRYNYPDHPLLYNLANDPGEKNNLASVVPEKAAEMEAKLDAWLQDVDAALPYSVRDKVTIDWDATFFPKSTGFAVGPPEGALTGWRSTTEVNYLARETWTLEEGDHSPERVTIQPHQANLQKQAFSFDGDDVMTRVFFHVSDPIYPTSYDNDHSSTFEFWLKLDSLDQEHILLESGGSTSGLSLTIGDADNDGSFNDVRLRARGTAANELTVTTDLDRFADPTKDFVHLTAVINDDESDRFAEVYVNGALFAHVAGASGSSEHINWDGFDEAGLGNVAGDELGGDFGSAELPFAESGFAGQLSHFRFRNYAIDAATVLSDYNAMLADVDSGIATMSATASSPAHRPSSLAEGAQESDDVIWVMHERNDILTAPLAVSVIPAGDQALAGGELNHNGVGVLPDGTALTSYLLHFDPEGDPTSLQNALATVTFEEPILGLIVGQSELAETDSLLGTVGEYATGPRSFASSITENLTISNDLHSLTVELHAVNDGIVQLRVLTQQITVPEPSCFVLLTMLGMLSLASPWFRPRWQ